MVVRLLACIFSCVAFATPQAAVITVNSSADSIGNDGQCTLREAIVAANTNTASGVAAGECAAGNAGLDTIAFNIPGTGVRTINAIGRMPTPTEPLLIDGYTQPGASENSLAVGNNAVLLIEISGASMPAFEPLFMFGPTSATTVRGLVINRVPSTTFLIGPVFLGPSSGNTIAGNFIGTDPTGTLLLDVGVSTLISIDSGSNNNTIGGPSVAARNVIAGGGTSGASRVAIRSANNVVQGNYLGTNATGTAAVLPAAPSSAISLEGSSATRNLIGGPTPGMGNLIVASGIGITLDQASGNTLQGNLIGTNAAGTDRLGGGIGSSGIHAVNVPGANVIGGSGARGNVVSGFGVGINLQNGPGTMTIQGNRIGTDSSGTGPIPNLLTGISIAAQGPGVIGGDAKAGEGNIIAFNQGTGINFNSSTSAVGWSILGNSIFANGFLGISFGGTTVPTPNDGEGDLDTGANNLQNYPVLTSASINGGNVHVSGSLSSGFNTTYRIEFFSNPACDSNLYGEGRTFLGATNVTTDDGGKATFSDLTFPVMGGAVITSTATVVAGAAFGDTSEFSACVGATVAPPAITKAFGAATIAVNGSTTLSFNITNQAQGNNALSGLAFVDNLPAGLVVATPSGLSGSCGTGLIGALAGSSVITLTDGTLPPGGLCVLSVNVTGTSAGIKTNTVSVTANETGPGNTSTATVRVIALPPSLVIAFGVPVVPVDGTTALTFIVANPNEGTTLTGVGFTDALPRGLVVSVPNGLTGSCGGGAITAIEGSTGISLAGASLAPGVSCTFAVSVIAISEGPQSNTTSAVISAEGGNGAPATAGLVISALPEQIPTLQHWAIALLGILIALAVLMRGIRSRMR